MDKIFYSQSSISACREVLNSKNKGYLCKLNENEFSIVYINTAPGFRYGTPQYKGKLVEEENGTVIYGTFKMAAFIFQMSCIIFLAIIISVFLYYAQLIVLETYSINIVWVYTIPIILIFINLYFSIKCVKNDVKKITDFFINGMKAQVQ